MTSSWKPGRSKTDYGGQLGVLADWDARDDVKAALQERLQIGDRFVVPWRPHDPASDEAAAFWRDNDGLWVVRDFSAARYGSLASVTLTELYAAYKTGELDRLKGGVLATWKVRMLIELGFVVAPELSLPAAPEGISPLAIAVYADISELVRCRWVPFPDEPFQASSPFLKRWSTVRAVRGAAFSTILAARNEVEESGLIYTVGETEGTGARRPTKLFLPVFVGEPRHAA